MTRPGRLLIASLALVMSVAKPAEVDEAPVGAVVERQEVGPPGAQQMAGSREDPVGAPTLALRFVPARRRAGPRVIGPPVAGPWVAGPRLRLSSRMRQGGWYGLTRTDSVLLRTSPGRPSTSSTPFSGRCRPLVPHPAEPTGPAATNHAPGRRDVEGPTGLG